MNHIRFFSLLTDSGVRIVLNSSTVDKVFSNNQDLYVDTFFYDASYVRSHLVNANFFKGFCEAQDLPTPHERSSILLSTRKLLLKVDGRREFGVESSSILVSTRKLLLKVGRRREFRVVRSPLSNSFRISACGAKHFMPCGVLLINFHTWKSYRNFLNNKSAFYEDLCHLESKCFPFGTYLPITSSATYFELKLGSFYQQAMIVYESLMLDVTFY